MYRVNYNDLTAGRHEIIMSGTLGQARTVGGLSAFCELRSLTQQFKQTVCEVDSITCRATFGDSKCGVDISTLWENGTVSAVGTETDRQFSADTAFSEGELVPGIVQWLTGENAGRSYEIEAHVVDIGGGSGGTPGDDDFASVVSLLHFNGADGSTTFTDVTGKTWTAAGNAQIDTAQSKFSGASGLFDGTGDFISASSSADFNVLPGDFTIEFHCRFASSAGNQAFFEGYLNSSNRWNVSLVSGAIVFYTIVGGTGSIKITASAPAATTWHHVALTKTGTTFTLWVNGSSVGTSTTASYYSGNVAMYVASGGTGSNYNGHIDDFRITKGVSRYASTFTPPALEFYDSAPSGGADLGTADLTFPTAFPIEVGDTFKWRTDCGKQFIRDCKDTWDNVLNFRGEPYIPVGDEATLATPGAAKPGPNSGSAVDNPWAQFE
jgi:hypothetical protein